MGPRAHRSAPGWPGTREGSRFSYNHIVSVPDAGAIAWTTMRRSSRRGSPVPHREMLFYTLPEHAEAQALLSELAPGYGPSWSSRSLPAGCRSAGCRSDLARWPTG